MSTGYESIDEDLRENYDLENSWIRAGVYGRETCMEGKLVLLLASLAFSMRIFISLEPASHLPASGSFSLSILHLRYVTD
jgi:hypothetical protein